MQLLAKDDQKRKSTGLSTPGASVPCDMHRHMKPCSPHDHMEGKDTDKKELGDCGC